jgi:tetrahydromethanopterin S-methyltransferase subunit E
MKTILLTALLCIISLTLNAQKPLSNEELTKRLNTGGEYLVKSSKNFAWGLGIGIAGTTATVLTSIYSKSTVAPIVLGSVTAAISLSFSISGIVNLSRSGKAFNGYVFYERQTKGNSWYKVTDAPPQIKTR